MITEIDDVEDEGYALARHAAECWGTRDPRRLAVRAGATVSAARWAPVTAGECDRARRRIIVNDNVVDLAAATAATQDAVRACIVAHELGHLLARTLEDDDERRLGRPLARARGERRADAFAAALLGDLGQREVRSFSEGEP